MQFSARLRASGWFCAKSHTNTKSSVFWDFASASIAASAMHRNRYGSIKLSLFAHDFSKRLPDESHFLLHCCTLKRHQRQSYFAVDSGEAKEENGGSSLTCAQDNYCMYDNTAGTETCWPKMH